MSYDYSLEIDTGGDEPHRFDVYFNDKHPALGSDGLAGNALMTESGPQRCGNYTSNVSGIWSECLKGGARELGRDHPERMSGLHGCPCNAIAPLLKAAVEWGIEHLDALRLLNPKNGWGDADGAITYLWDIQRACEMHPKCSLHLSY